MDLVPVLVILAALVVAGFVFKDKILAAIKKKLGKEPEPAKPAPTVEPVKPPADPVADYQSKLPASTLAFKGKNGDPKPVGPADRSGDDLSDGSPLTRRMTAGKPEAFRFTLRKNAKNPEIAVMGAPGKIGELGPLVDSIPTVRAMTKVNLERMQLKYQLKLEGVGAGDYTYILQTSKDGDVAVQLHQ